MAVTIVEVESSTVEATVEVVTGEGTTEFNVRWAPIGVASDPGSTWAGGDPPCTKDTVEPGGAFASGVIESAGLAEQVAAPYRAASRSRTIAEADTSKVA